MISMFLCCSSIFNQKEPRMKNKPYTIEIVRFKGNSKYSENQIQQALTALNDIIKLYPGFIDRITASNQEGIYVDLVYWTDMDSAKEAGDDILKNPKAAEIFKVIRPETIQMHHLTVFNQFEE